MSPAGPNTGTARTKADLLELYADYKAPHTSNRQLDRDKIESLFLYPALAGELLLGYTPNEKFQYGDIRRLGAGAGATPALNAAAINAMASLVPDSGGSVFIPSLQSTATYGIGGNLVFKQRTRVYSDGRAQLLGVGAVGHVFTVTAQGALTGLSTAITATILRGDKTVNVGNTAGYNVGDPIELAGSAGAVAEAQNFVNGPQRELNEIQSITDGTHLVLKYPAAHSYTFDGTYTTQATVSKVTTVDDVSFEGIDFDTLELVHGYNRDFQLDRVRMLNQADINSFGTSSLNVDMKRVKIQSGIASPGANATAFFHGYRYFDINVKTFGGHFDGLQFFGCADGEYHATVTESTGRGLYLYKCDSVKTPWSEVQGTQVSGVTNEALLFNYSYDCDFTGVLDERFKLSSITEFRGDSRNCRIINATVYCAYTYPVTWKGLAQDCALIGGTWYSYYNGSAGYLVDLQIQAGMPYPSLLIDGPRLISKGPNTGFGVMRSVSTTESNVAGVSIMTLRNITFDRGASNLLGLTGTGAGQPINRLTIENCHSTTDDAATGALAICQLPVTNLRFNNVTLTRGTTRIIQLLSGTITNLYVYGVDALTLQVGANVLNIWLGNNAISNYTIPSLAVVRAGILNGLVALDFPSIAAGASADLSVTVTGLVAGDFVMPFVPAALPAGLVLGPPIAATDSLKFRLANDSAAANDPANATYGYQLIRRG